MIRRNELESSGAQIVPTARRGIHQPPQYIELDPQKRMGKIGLIDDDLGFDETDNVQSKFSKFQDVSPAFHSRPKIVRQNSTDTSNNLSSDADANTDEENKRVHSQSLPTYLQYSTYSDIPNEFKKHNTSSPLDTSPGKRLFYVTEHRRTSLNSSNNDYENIRNNRIYKTTPTRRKESSNLGTLIGALSALVCLIAILFWMYVPTSRNNLSYDVFKFYNDMDNLRIQYQISKDSILQVKTGISTIYEQNDAGSFVFAYDSTADKFKTEIIDRLVDDISLSAAKYLRNDTLPVKHLAVVGSDLQMSYHGDLINQYRGDVAKTGVMLIKDVDNVPSNVAMAFHYYCDEYNPLVRKSAIFFTLDLAKCNDKAVYKTTHAKIEKCLTNKWSSVPEDNIKPLLTRVVSVVVDLTNIF